MVRFSQENLNAASSCMKKPSDMREIAFSSEQQAESPSVVCTSSHCLPTS